MVCTNCGCNDKHNLRFCINCGQPLHTDAPPPTPPPLGAHTPEDRRKKALVISIAAAAALLVAFILVLILFANPVAGRWYAQDGTELFFLKNGKGMTISSDDASRVHFMYAVGYKEPGYIEGEIYDKEGSGNSWFYIYDGKLEWKGRYYYRHRPAAPTD